MHTIKKQLLLIILLTLTLITNPILAMNNTYQNNITFFQIFKDDFNYKSIKEMEETGYSFTYFSGELKNGLLIGYKRSSIDSKYEAYIQLPIKECLNSVVYELRARYNGVSRVSWIILSIKNQGYKFNYGIGYDITFYHSGSNKIIIFKANGRLKPVWNKPFNIPSGEWHTYKVIFNNYKISIYVDNTFVGEYTDTNKSYPICGSVALMYEQGYGSAEFDWIKITQNIQTIENIKTKIQPIEKRLNIQPI